MKRRGFLVAFASLPAAAQVRVPTVDVGPLVRAITNGAPTTAQGLEVELPQIAENGNSVPLLVRIASPMSAADHVKAIHVFAERNPRPRVATFHLGPDSGRGEVTARIRLAATGDVTVLAELSGNRFLLRATNVLVTLGACLDEAGL